MSQAEVSFGCFIFGETGNPSGKDILLKLTHDNNYKIRSSAFNALVNIKYDINDLSFVNSVSQRLTECASEKSDKKLYNKDITFAFSNYKLESNIPVLQDLLFNEYFGVRFIAAENLKSYGDTYYSYISNELIQKVVNNYELNPFLISIENLSEKNYKKVIEKIRQVNIDEISAVNLFESVRLRESRSNDQGFIEWCNSQLSELVSKAGDLKIK